MIDVRHTPVSLRLRLRRHRRLAGRYVDSGWPVAAGAWWDGDRYRCEAPSCSVTGPHGAGHGDTATRAAGSRQELAAWPARPYTLLLLTGSVVDVLELPARAESAAAAMTASPHSVPAARLPTGRWLLFGAPGEVSDDAAAAARARGVLHHGSGWHVPLPPSRLAQGRVRWVARPAPSSRGLLGVAELLELVLPSVPPSAAGMALTLREAR